MKVSIITISYNSENTILKTIESVNQQTYEDVEHIFIDGKSEDLIDNQKVTKVFLGN